MVWAQLDINRPHLVYIILGGFTSLFMLCSSVIKEKFYIGEATIATLCGIIFGPHAANLINPGTWGNTDQITLEFSRIVLVVQCFAVGVELPRAYMERHWRSVVFLLVPVMTFGWLVTSLFIWALIPGLNWLDGLTIAACVTATDPVLASSVVGKGKFAKRVPKHLRDLLSAESGCNDGMAFPFIYLALYLIEYRPDSNAVSFHWFCYTILYECIFGAVYGVCVGYIGRRAIRYAHEKDLIDRESFLVFYFVLALFCAGSGSMLGMDDLLIGFACGVGFSNDGWFTEKTEEAHVSNVIDLLINLAFFVYFGTIIPWELYNVDLFGLMAWRLVVIGLLVLFFRRIPVMLALKPLIPDIKTWREALFAGHFGPIGVGAIFVAILARAELETGTTTPLEVLPSADFEHDNIIALIWPITSFLVICSIIVHGSSIAVFTLGKHINTLSLTLSYTQGNEETSWMERLPRIQSRSKSSMSARRSGDDSESGYDDKMSTYDLPTGVVPKNFLRRQQEEDKPSRNSSLQPPFFKNKREGSRGRSRHGGPVSQSAIAPLRSPGPESSEPQSRSDSDTLAFKNDASPEDTTETRRASSSPEKEGEPEGEIYEEGHETVYEDEEGNVLEVEDSQEGQTDEQRQQHERQHGLELMSSENVHHGVARTKDDPKADNNEPALHAAKSAGQEIKDKVQHPFHWRRGMKRMGTFVGQKDDETTPKTPNPQAEPKRNGPARAYQYGNTIIVEDEDGEVIKKYDIPGAEKKKKADKKGENKGDAVDSGFADPKKTRQRLNRMTSYIGMGPGPSKAATETNAGATGKGKAKKSDNNNDDGMRFTVTSGGTRMSQREFIEQIQRLDPKLRAKVVEESNVPEAVKEEAREDAREHIDNKERAQKKSKEEPKGLEVKRQTPASSTATEGDAGNDTAKIKKLTSGESGERGPEGLTLVDSNEEDIPLHDVSGDVHRASMQANTGQETAAQRRRREARLRAEQQKQQVPEEEDSEDDGTDRVPPIARSGGPSISKHQQTNVEGETAAERRRREGALGVSKEESDSEDESNAPRQVPNRPGIRFADEPTPREGKSVGRRVWPHRGDRN